MLNLKSAAPSLPTLPAVTARDFPLPVLVWVETHTGEWYQLPLRSPMAALHALDEVLGSSTDAEWHFVVGRLTDALRDPAPLTLERARHALAVFAARLGVLAG